MCTNMKSWIVGMWIQMIDQNMWSYKSNKTSNGYESTFGEMWGQVQLRSLTSIYYLSSSTSFLPPFWLDWLWTGLSVISTPSVWLSSQFSSENWGPSQTEGLSWSVDFWWIYFWTCVSLPFCDLPFHMSFIILRQFNISHHMPNIHKASKRYK